MSPEKATTVEPNRLNRGEGCQDWTLANLATSGRGRNDRWSNHRHGDVCHSAHVQRRSAALDFRAAPEKPDASSGITRGAKQPVPSRDHLTVSG
jgi:hypothetical protein